ncbi:MAG: phospho-N-acetylmuramoyl-pentapeptide-transferase [candidate division WS1 bacterium]|jgi:phospho-N-acetylmuramoyl-pentapeptide-transferase|nr:phospho-N-acetylmuramoyl-pentapeptide-transferase [candidate division WS1 bacterium]
MRIEQLWVMGILVPFGVALLLGVLLTRLMLAAARRRQLRQHIREDGPQSHLAKAGTPAMGGLALMAAVVLVAAGVLAKTGWNYRLALPLLLGLLFAGVGLLDDLAKLRKDSPYGLSARWRLLMEFVLAFGVLAWLVSVEFPGPESFSRSWGFSALGAQSYDLALRMVWVLLTGFVVVATANAVNITDGVDGLAATTLGICALALATACFFRGMGDRTVLAAAVAGAAFGFLWFNAHPAKIFMGDVGALGLGALLGAVAVSAGLEWLFGLLALVFIVETVSVILQVLSFKLTGKRIFRMTPIHHAFEMRGWSEPQVVARFALVGLFAALLGLSLMLALFPGR